MGTPPRALNARGRKKLQFLTNISLQLVNVYAAKRLTSIGFCFRPCNIYRDCPRRGVPREAKMCKKMC